MKHCFKYAEHLHLYLSPNILDFSVAVSLLSLSIFLHSTMRKIWNQMRQPKFPFIIFIQNPQCWVCWQPARYHVPLHRQYLSPFPLRLLTWKSSCISEYIQEHKQVCAQGLSMAMWKSELWDSATCPWTCREINIINGNSVRFACL